MGAQQITWRRIKDPVQLWRPAPKSLKKYAELNKNKLSIGARKFKIKKSVHQALVAESGEKKAEQEQSLHSR